MRDGIVATEEKEMLYKTIETPASPYGLEVAALTKKRQEAVQEKKTKWKISRCAVSE